MKKTLYLILTLALLFPTISSAAISYNAGCTATTKFSMTTGKPCVKSKIDCGVGDVYSISTGKKCGVVETPVTTPVKVDKKTLTKCEVDQAKLAVLVKQNSDLQVNYDKKVKELQLNKDGKSRDAIEGDISNLHAKLNEDYNSNNNAMNTILLEANQICKK